MIVRRKTRTIEIGKLKMGSEHPILIQSMNNTDTRNVEASLSQIYALAASGCDLTRLAIPDQEAADALKLIVSRSPLPIVADIHFDYRLALEAIKNGAAKIRINPGNIGSKDRIKKVCVAAKSAGVPIRIGVNSGSIQHKWLKKYGGVNAESLCACALEALEQVQDFGIENLVLSLKASDPLLTIEAYRLIAEQCDFPLHLGVTEAGTLREGVIRSAVGIGTLLAEGIGDTLRVSLTADPLQEVKAAWSILKALNLRERGVVFVSCPGCGRTEVDLTPIANEVEARLQAIDMPLKVAVMGCIVNGPGEAREADFGIAGGKDEFILFAKGKLLGRVPQEKAIDQLMDLIYQEVERRKAL